VKHDTVIKYIFTKLVSVAYQGFDLWRRGDVDFLCQRWGEGKKIIERVDGLSISHFRIFGQIFQFQFDLKRHASEASEKRKKCSVWSIHINIFQVNDIIV